MLVLLVIALSWQVGGVVSGSLPDIHKPVKICDNTVNHITITRTHEEAYVKTVTITEPSYHYEDFPVTNYILETVDTFITHQVTVTPSDSLTTILHRQITTPYYYTTTATYYNTVFDYESCRVLVTDVSALNSVVLGKETEYIYTTYTSTTTTYSLSTMYQTSEWHKTKHSVVTFSTNVPHFITSTQLVTSITTLISTYVDNFPVQVTATLAFTETIFNDCSPSTAVVEQPKVTIKTENKKGETGKSTVQKIKEFFRDKITNKFLTLFGKGVKKYGELESKGIVHPLTDALATEKGQEILSGGLLGGGSSSSGKGSGKSKGKGKGKGQESSGTIIDDYYDTEYDASTFIGETKQY